MRRAGAAFAALWALAGAASAIAQDSASPTFSMEAASDERRRGLSWSDGAPVVRAGASITIGADMTFEARATSLWGGRRHGDADAVIDLTARYAHTAGPWRWEGEAAYRLFPGASGMGFGEIGATATYMIGPASIDIFARYAPPQSAIGGDNLHVGGGLSVGIPATPWTVSAHVGRSSGDADNPARATRLRPDGAYWDHGVAIDYYRRNWSAGLRYANSSMDRAAARHAGASLIGRFAVAF